MDENQQADAFYELVRGEVSARVSRLEMPVPKRPESVEFEVDISRVPDDELTKQIAYWAAQVGYGKYQASLLDAAATRAELEYSQEVDLRSLGRDGSAAARRASAAASSTARSHKRRATILRTEADVLSALVKGYEMKYAAASRELTRRVKISED